MLNPTPFGLRAVAILFLVTGLSALAPRSASATYIADWSFDDPVQTVGPFDSVTMEATLVNLSTSGEHILGSDLTVMIYHFGTTSPNYSFSFGPVFIQFAGLDLAPGESFGFTFGTLTPVAPPVPFGVYSSPHSILQLQGTDFDAGTFEVHVVPEPVPEPGTMLLLGGGLVGLAGRRRRTR